MCAQWRFVCCSPPPFWACERKAWYGERKVGFPKRFLLRTTISKEGGDLWGASSVANCLSGKRVTEREIKWINKKKIWLNRYLVPDILSTRTQTFRQRTTTVGIESKTIAGINRSAYQYTLDKRERRLSGINLLQNGELVLGDFLCKVCAGNPYYSSFFNGKIRFYVLSYS